MELINNASLKSYVTFGVEASCEHLYRIEDIEELKLALRYLKDPLILGGGSNVLPIGHLKRDVIRIELGGIETEEVSEENILIHAGAGENWHEFVLWAVDNGLGGIENLSLIPGTIGAAPIQNIGAYGVELESVFDSLEAIRIKDGRLIRFQKGDCRFGYRDSIFKQEGKDQFVITKVTLRLKRGHHQINTSYGVVNDVLVAKGITSPTIRDVSNAVMEIRQSKLPDPAVTGNAGSFFKNPVIPKELFDRLKSNYPDIPSFPMDEVSIKIPAGWLIEQTGWKGKSLGRAGSYEKQALVLVNRGGATGEEIWDLAMEIVRSVSEKFGVELSPEVNVWR